MNSVVPAFFPREEWVAFILSHSSRREECIAFYPAFLPHSSRGKEWVAFCLSFVSENLVEMAPIVFAIFLLVSIYIISPPLIS